MTPSDYLGAARRDRRRAFLLLTDGDAPGACFHTQQAIEKAIKAVIVAHALLDEASLDFRTHRIEDLFDVVDEADIALPAEASIAALFTVCAPGNDRAVDLRYDESIGLPALPNLFLGIVDAIIAWAESHA